MVILVNSSPHQNHLHRTHDSLHIVLLSLHTSPFIQPGQGDAGGMNVYVNHLAKNLVARGHRVDVVTVWRQDEHPGESSPGVSERWQLLEPALRMLHVVFADTVAASKDDIYPHLPAITEHIHQAYAEHGDQPDVVHGHYWLSAVAGMDLARRWGVPLISTFHTTALAKNNRAGHGEQRETPQRADAELQIMHHSTAVVVNTSSEAEDLTRYYPTSPPTALEVITPGVDTTIFYPAPRSQQSTGSLTVGFAGRLQALKGPHVLLHALAHLKKHHDDVPITLWIAGVGSRQFTDELNTIIDTHGLGEAVEMTGSLPARELAARFRASDLVAVASSSETFGLVALEAQACGTPVLATDADGLRHVVHDGVTGWLVPDRDPATWAHHLLDIAHAPQQRHLRGQAAAQWAQRFSWAATAQAHEKLYRKRAPASHTVDM